MIRGRPLSGRSIIVREREIEEVEARITALEEAAGEPG
jgi:hypothetical protein